MDCKSHPLAWLSQTAPEGPDAGKTFDGSYLRQNKLQHSISLIHRARARAVRMSAFLILFASVSRNTPADQGFEYGTGKNGEEKTG